MTKVLSQLSVYILPLMILFILIFVMVKKVNIYETFIDGAKEGLKTSVDVLPIMIVRSLSGSANIGVLNDVVSSAGVNSYAAKLAAIMVGSSETTFYVLAVYFGAVGIKKLRYALITGLMADAIGIIVAVCVASWLFL